MKPGIHPDYREVVFQDMSNGFKFITRSTIQTRENIELDGKTYPLAKIEVSSESHSFYTGQQKIMDTAGVSRSSRTSSAFAPAARRSKLCTASGGCNAPVSHKRAAQAALFCLCSPGKHRPASGHRPDAQLPARLQCRMLETGSTARTRAGRPPITNRSSA